MNSTKKTPLPTSITVRNFFPPLATIPASDDSIASASSASDSEPHITDDAEQTGHDALSSNAVPDMALSSFRNNRCDLMRGMLVGLRLDIVLKRPSAECEDDVVDTRNDVTTIFCTLPNKSGGSAHPRWDYVNEQIIQNHTCQSDEWERDIYPLLYARFVILDQKPTNHPSSSSNEHVLLAEVPLHPSHLRPLPYTSDASATFATIQIPPSLTPNSILVHYDDGCTRVLPSLFWLLVRKNVIDQSSGSLLAKPCYTEDGSARFNERAFDMLGGTSDNNSSPRVVEKRMTEANSIYDDKVFDLLGEKTEVVCTPSSNDTRSQTENEKNNHISLIAHEEMDNRSEYILVDHESAFNHEIEPVIVHHDGGIPENDAFMAYDAVTSTSSREQFIRSGPSSAQFDELHVPSPLSTEAGLNEFLLTKKEVAELRQQVHHEGELLKREQRWMNQEVENLRSLIERVQHLQRETTELISHADTERVNLFRKRVCLEAHRAHLLKQLRLIFPIKIALVDAQGGDAISSPAYHEITIAGIPLPDDIHHPSISDDQVSIALGFTCHLIALTSKYMDVPLRHKIVCKYSRSAIIDEGGGRGLNSIQNKATAVVYPLFRERGVVDKEQLDQGFMLLTRNVEALLRMRQVQYHEEWNILVKLDRLHSYITDGKQGSCMAD